MDDVSGPLLLHDLPHLGSVGHIKGDETQVRIEPGQLVGAARGGHHRHARLLMQQRHQLLTQQTIGAGDENFHEVS